MVVGHSLMVIQYGYTPMVVANDDSASCRRQAAFPPPGLPGLAVSEGLIVGGPCRVGCEWSVLDNGESPW